METSKHTDPNPPADDAQPDAAALHLSRGPSRTFMGLTDEVRRLSGKLVDGSIERSDFLECCTRLTASAIGCSRAGIWLFVDTAEGRVMRCLAMYDSVNDRMTTAPDEKVAVEAYFDAFDESGFVMADDVHSHPATAGLFARRLGTMGVRSLLASSFSVNGHLFGTLTCTDVGKSSTWTSRQLAMLRQVGGPASLALYKTSRFTADTGFAPLIS
jgi:GAF domain-containing protein